MRQIIIYAVIISTLYEIHVISAATVDANMKVSLENMSKELQQKKSNETIINNLRKKLVNQEKNEALIKQLRSQIGFQTQIIENLSANSKLIENYENCKTELATKSTKLEILEVQLEELNFSLLKKNQEIAKLIINNKNTSELQLENYIEIENHGKCQRRLADESKNLEICGVQLKKLKFSLLEKDQIISTLQNGREYRKTIQKNNNKDKDHLRPQLLNRTLEIFSSPNCIPFRGSSGLFKIGLPGSEAFDVLCDNHIAGPGWLVIQQRIGGSQDFNVNWTTYRNGFGSFNSDFFLGLEKIHLLTSLRTHELYVNLVDEYDSNKFVWYDDFKISDEENGYALSLGKTKLNSSDDFLKYHRNMKFSTFDRDNDLNKRLNCAKQFRSGWWFNNCFKCDLNHRQTKFLQCNTTPYKEVKMLIRPKQ
ncbi:fibroleukin-like isoform X1 [Drosophila albomicans]|uniref:Fibroleukin-like isoform X1 n=2 Tax=Drosophila albomicans TaxID=7291 RepID=A0A6P8X471_DROAB|nr:fibroleukin-like isoform X1 [Drosophila albomicans]